MPVMKEKKKLRPSTASGIIQSVEVKHILEDLRPSTAPGIKEPPPGLEPTYVTSQRPIGVGATSANKLKGKQVHGGIDKNDLKGVHGRRATLGPTENLSLFNKQNQPKRPTTAVGHAKAVKVILI